MPHTPLLQRKSKKQTREVKIQNLSLPKYSFHCFTPLLGLYRCWFFLFILFLEFGILGFGGFCPTRSDFCFFLTRRQCLCWAQGSGSRALSTPPAVRVSACAHGACLAMHYTCAGEDASVCPHALCEFSSHFISSTCEKKVLTCPSQREHNSETKL